MLNPVVHKVTMRPCQQTYDNHAQRHAKRFASHTSSVQIYKSSAPSFRKAAFIPRTFKRCPQVPAVTDFKCDTITPHLRFLHLTQVFWHVTLCRWVSVSIFRSLPLQMRVADPGKPQPVTDHP